MGLDNSFVLTYVDSLDIKALKSSRSIRRIALKWLEISSGETKAIDRTSKADRFGYTCDIHGSFEYVNNVRQLLKNSMKENDRVVVNDVSTPFLGVDVDYTQPVEVYCIRVSVVEKVTLNAYRLTFELRTGVLSFVSATSQIPTLKRLSAQIKSGRELPISTEETIYNDDNSGFVSIGYGSGGIRSFEGAFQFTKSELQELLTFQRTQRKAAFDMPTIPGVQYPFGYEAGDTGLRARLFSISDISGDSHLFSAKIIFTQAEL